MWRDHEIQRSELAMEQSKPSLAQGNATVERDELTLEEARGLAQQPERTNADQISDQQDAGPKDDGASLIHAAG